MKMTTLEINTLEINSMPIEDRLILMENIWSSFHSNEDEVDSPSWHEEILLDRLEGLKNGTAKLMTIDELRNR